MALSRHRGRPRFVLLFLVLTSITVMTLDFRGQGSGVVSSLRGVAADAMAPLRSAADAVARPVGNVWTGITAYDDLERENAELRAQLEALDPAGVASAGARQELDQLLASQGLVGTEAIPSVTARVVSAPVSNFDLTIELDRGRDDGVEVDMPVVTGAGLVGRVVQASGGRAVVRLLSDQRSSVGVRLVASGDVAVANGAGRGEDLSVDLVDAGVGAAEGEGVVTSGLAGSVFPPGLPVGRVTVGRDASAPAEQPLRVAPAAELGRLQFVRVLRWRPEGDVP